MKSIRIISKKKFSWLNKFIVPEVHQTYMRTPEREANYFSTSNHHNASNDYTFNDNPTDCDYRLGYDYTELSIR